MTIDANRRVFRLAATQPEIPSSHSMIWLTPTTDLDLSSERDAREELAQVCSADADYRWIVVQGHRDWFVDVRGLDVLLDADKRAEPHGRRVVVVEPPWSLTRIISVLTLPRQLILLDSASDADLLDLPRAR